MEVNKKRILNVRLLFLFCLAFIPAIPGQPVIATAATAAQVNFQSILRDSMADIWTGGHFSTELQDRQQTMKAMLANGSIDKARLENMMKANFISILNRLKTSRYILKEAPERFEALLSPHLNWQEVRTLMWQAGTTSVDKNDPVLITFGTLAPPGTPWVTLPETRAIPELENMTGGKLLIKVYNGGSMGDDTEILRKMKDRQIDGCGCTALGVLEACPEAAVLSSPGLFNNYEEVDYIIEKFRKRLDQSFENRGYILAALIDTGFFYLFSKNKVSGLESLRKQEVFTWIGSIETGLYQELGIKPLGVTVPEVVSALNMGHSGTVLLPPVWVLGMQAYQFTGFYLKPPLIYSPAAIFASRYTMSRIQKQIGVSDMFIFNLKEMIVYEFNSLEPEWMRQLRNYDAKSLKAFETKCGMKAISFSPEDRQAINKASIAVQQQLAGKAYPEDLMNDIFKALEDYRARH